ncbi:MAG: hypothetical protein J6W29_07645, partial [Neisseriaceae bacterium]|nr:hypothetical protein [Neisseriaceae bacterium]
MKKVIISVLIGVIFGGVGVFATMQENFTKQNNLSMVSNAKGLPETSENAITAVKNKQTDTIKDNKDNYTCNPDDILEKNISFSFANNDNAYTVFNIKKRTNSELEFKLTYKNEKLNSPFVLTGIATAGFSNDDKTNYCEMDAEPATIVSDD